MKDRVCFVCDRELLKNMHIAQCGLHGCTCTQKNTQPQNAMEKKESWTKRKSEISLWMQLNDSDKH